MEALFVAPRSVSRRRFRISRASADEVGRWFFCAHPGPKLPLSRLDLPDFADLRGFPGNHSDPAFPRLNRRRSTSRELEPARRFLSQARLNRVAHETIGLLGAGIYLLSYAPIFFEMQIRSDAVCMFFEILIIWLLVQFFYYRVISPNKLSAVVYGTAIGVSAFLLASLKPSFTLMALFTVAPVIWLIVNAKGNFTGKLAFFGITVPIIVALTLAEHDHRRNDQVVKMFLPETLFVIHAKIIHAQMSADLIKGNTDIYSAEWLRVACDDLEREIQRTHDLYPRAF